MAFVDMAYLQTKNIRDNEIVYTRRKTGQPLRIRIEPCMREIIVRHAAATYPSYLFPILRTTEPDKAFSQYQTALNRYNQQLKELAQRLNLKEIALFLCSPAQLGHGCTKTQHPPFRYQRGDGAHFGTNDPDLSGFAGEFGNRCCQSEDYGCFE